MGPTPEDLDRVLSRFQKWSGTQSGTAASKSGSPSNTGRTNPSKKANLAAGARELSYEQALRATSYRRQIYQVPSTPPAANAGAELPDLGSVATAAEKTLSASAFKASSDRPPKVPNNVEPRARRARMAAPPVVEIAPAAVVGATKRRKKASGAGLKSSVRTGGGNSTPRPNLAPVVPVGPPSTESNQPRNSTSSRASSIQPAIAQPAFREVLQQSAGLAATAKDSAAVENKTIALSLRVSDAEQARIQACAARANVSVSAYLRQCALGVEELRDQVELALGELRKQDAQKAALPGLSQIPRILRQVAAGWFRRLRGKHDFTGISLR
jgi:hypothetical protein